MTAEDVNAMRSAINASDKELQTARDRELEALGRLLNGEEFRLSGDVLAFGIGSGVTRFADDGLARDIREFINAKLSEKLANRASTVVATIGAYQLGMSEKQITELNSPPSA